MNPYMNPTIAEESTAAAQEAPQRHVTHRRTAVASHSSVSQQPCTNLLSAVLHFGERKIQSQTSATSRSTPPNNAPADFLRRHGNIFLEQDIAVLRKISHTFPIDLRGIPVSRKQVTFTRSQRGSFGFRRIETAVSLPTRSRASKSLLSCEVPKQAMANIPRSMPENSPRRILVHVN